MSASRAVTSSVINEAKPVETAAAASVRERMVTACNVPASAAPVLGTLTVPCFGPRALPKPVGRGIAETLKTKVHAAGDRVDGF